MGQFFESIPASLIPWILAQKMFWVSSAPLSGSGHVNVSPKGGAYFGVISPTLFWYMDLTGSGNETISHIYEPGNGRVTILFNAFEGPPRILRLFGTGRVLENGTRAFDTFIAEHEVKTIPGSRSIILVDIHQVGTSCGFSVPYYDFKEFRPILNDFFAKKAEKVAAGNEKESMPRYWAFKNAWSMDGLPGLVIGRKTGSKERIEPLKKMVGPLASVKYRRPSARYTLVHLVLVALLSALISVIVVLQQGERIVLVLQQAFHTVRPALHVEEMTFRKGVDRLVNVSW